MDIEKITSNLKECKQATSTIANFTPNPYAEPGNK